MCVCMHLCECVHVCVSVLLVYLCWVMHVCVRTCVWAYVYVWACACVWACVCVLVCWRVGQCECVCVSWFIEKLPNALPSLQIWAQSTHTRQGEEETRGLCGSGIFRRTVLSQSSVLSICYPSANRASNSGPGSALYVRYSHNSHLRGTCRKHATKFRKPEPKCF